MSDAELASSSPKNICGTYVMRPMAYSSMAHIASQAMPASKVGLFSFVTSSLRVAIACAIIVRSLGVIVARRSTRASRS